MLASFVALATHSAHYRVTISPQQSGSSLRFHPPPLPSPSSLCISEHPLQSTQDHLHVDRGWPALACPGLDWPALAFPNLPWTGLDWPGLAWTGLPWPGLTCPRLPWTGLDQPGPAWTGLDRPGTTWSCLDWPFPVAGSGQQRSD
jgi:hypothetical protein